MFETSGHYLFHRYKNFECAKEMEEKNGNLSWVRFSLEFLAPRTELAESLFKKCGCVYMQCFSSLWARPKIYEHKWLVISIPHAIIWSAYIVFDRCESNTMTYIEMRQCVRTISIHIYPVFIATVEEISSSQYMHIWTDCIWCVLLRQLAPTSGHSHCVTSIWFSNWIRRTVSNISSHH